MNNTFKHVLSVGALAALSLPLMAFAEGPYATFEIKVESAAVESEVSPVVSSPITKCHVQFHILNNTGKQLYFVNGQAQSYIPVVSNNTVTAPYQVGQQYQLVDAEGHSVAKWNLDNVKIGVPNVASASQSQFSQWGSTIQQVIENQKVSYQEPPAKAEPHYYESNTTRTSGVIRGYW